VLEHISGNISETRKDTGKVTMEGLYRKSPTLFLTVPSPAPYHLFPKIGGSLPHPKLQSLSQEQLKLWTSHLAGTFIRTKVHEKFGRKGSVDISGDYAHIFEYPLLSPEQVKLRTSNSVRLFTASIGRN